MATGGINALFPNEEMVQRRDLLLARLRSRGALTMEIAPGKLSTNLVNHYLDVKERSLI